MADLSTLRFVENRRNVILLGTPGAGKTHLAIAVGVATTEAGYRTCFIAPPTWSRRCRRRIWRVSPS